MKPFKKGDRVSDRFKVPRPGDECTTGTVLKCVRGVAEVKWDDGRSSNIIEALLERTET